MKSLIIALSIAALPLVSSAQKCKYDVDKADPFTKEMIQSTTLKIGPKVINGRKNYEVGWTMTFEKNGKDKFIAFKVIMFGKFDEIVEPGQKVLLRLEDDTIIELVADKQVLPVYMTAMAVYTHYDLKFKTDDATLQKLASAGVTNFKMQLNEREIVAEITKGDKIMKTAECFK